jgi:hypothetical protein
MQNLYIFLTSKCKISISVSPTVSCVKRIYIILAALLFDNTPCTCDTDLQLHHLSHCQWKSLGKFSNLLLVAEVYMIDLE